MSDPENLEQAQWAIDLLTNHHGIERSFLGKYGFEIWFTGAGLLSVICTNYIRSRALGSGIHRHVIGTLFGFGVGRAYSMIDKAQTSKRDAILVDYVKLHPDRFPEKKPKKYAEILQPWTPMR